MISLIKNGFRYFRFFSRAQRGVCVTVATPKRQFLCGTHQQKACTSFFLIKILCTKSLLFEHIWVLVLYITKTCVEVTSCLQAKQIKNLRYCCNIRDTTAFKRVKSTLIFIFCVKWLI